MIPTRRRWPLSTATLRAASGRGFSGHPADILVTTPESLLPAPHSRARDALRSFADGYRRELHAVIGTKRGAHLALSLERLEALSECPLQRIGLSATQRPVHEARDIPRGFTGGARGR